MASLKEHAERLVRAIDRMSEEHGRDNTFGFVELTMVGGPEPLIAGRAARAYPELLAAHGACVDEKGRVAV